MTDHFKLCPSCGEKNNPDFGHCRKCSGSLKKYINKDKCVYVVAVARQMMEETERVSRLYINDYFKREPQDKVIFRIRLFAAGFPLAAMMNVFGEECRQDWLKTYQVCMSYIEEGLAVSDEEKAQIFDDHKNLLVKGLAAESNRNGSGQEMIGVFYLKALADSMDELEKLHPKNAAELKAVISAVVTNCLEASRGIERHLGER